MKTFLSIVLAVLLCVVLVYLLIMGLTALHDDNENNIKYGRRCLKCKKSFKILEHKHNLNKSPIYYICVCDECYEKYYKDKENTNE